jgi:NDP-sugar pyrophosphorylase family protein
VLGSAGGPRLALPLLGADRFLIVNGDTLAEVDLHALASAHAASGALVTLALAPNRDPMRYGGVRLDADSRVAGFVPRGGGAADAWHFTGIQIAQAEAFAGVAAGRPVASIGGVYDDLLAARPGAIHGVAADWPFWDIGTVADYWQTSRALMDAAPVGLDPWRGRRVRVGDGARVDRSILWDDVDVGAHAVLEECIVADGVEVPAGAVFRRSALVRADAGLIVSPIGAGENGR